MSAQGADFLDITKKFAPTALIEEFDTTDSKTFKRIKDRRQVGVVNGVAFTFYSDGSGSFGRPETDAFDGRWHTRCETDAMTDLRSCFILRGSLGVGIRGIGELGVSIGHSHYPGSSIALRLDQGRPLIAGEGGWDGRAARDVIAQLKVATTVTTRYMEFPYQTYKDETFETFGFNEALAFVAWAVARQPHGAVKPVASDSGAQSANATLSPVALAPLDANLVKLVQYGLLLNGYKLGRPDGQFGPKTREAILAYQRANGLPASGQPSQTLLDHMVSLP